MAQSVEFEVNASDKTRKGLTSAQKNLKKTSVAADTLASRFRNVARSASVMEGPLGPIAGRLSAVATLLGNANVGAIAFGAGIAALTAIVGMSIKEFSQFEKQQFKISSLLKQTGNASGLTANSIEDMAVRLGEATLESADGIRSAAGMLLTFKSISGDAFERTISLATDMSAISGTLEEKILQLGKALEDPANGMSALRRSGVSFTNSQKDMIVAMKESGDVAGYQREIFKLLEGQLGGTGAAAGKGLAGAADLVAERWNMWLITLGKSGAGDTAAGILNRIAAGMAKVNKMMGGISDSEAINEKLKERQVLLDRINKMAELNPEARAIPRLKQKANLLRDEINILIEKTKLESQAAADAHMKGVAEQQVIKETAAAELAYEAAKVKAKEVAKKLDKDTEDAVNYGDKLATEVEQYRNSLLEKSHAEDMYLEERLTKISENEADNLISKQDAYQQEQDAYALHSAKVTEIHRLSAEERAKTEEEIEKLKQETILQGFNDAGSLMQAGNRKLFTIGKAAALAGAIIAGQKSAAESLANGGGYPWGVAAMLGSMAKTGINIATIAKTKMSGARQMGGPVIGDRNYLVGEDGPEIFKAPRSGTIVNNNSISNGGSNVANVTFVLPADEQIKDVMRNNKALLTNIVSSWMNEQGHRFA